MAVEIRPVGAEEADAFHFLVAYSFAAADRTPEGRLSMRHLEELGQALALYQDGQMVAGLRLLPLSMGINGAAIPLGGVAAVACLPEHRRQGYVGQLLRFALEKMRDDGYPLSALYTPHPALYRRYGWMIAATAVLYRFQPKDIGPAATIEPAGHPERLSEEDWPRLDALYRRYIDRRNGFLVRSERWWREAVLHDLYDPQRHLNDAAVWVNGQGQDSGYLVYRSRRRFEGPPPLSALRVRDFIALDREAFIGLLRYLLSHDLIEEVQWWTSASDPMLAVAIDEPWRLQGEARYGFLLRVVDVARALAQRPLAPRAPEGSFTLKLADAAAPWNEGLWRIEAHEGRLRVEKASGAAHLATDAATFAALYNGFLRPSDAATFGLLAAESEEALALADRLFATEYAPYCADVF